MRLITNLRVIRESWEFPGMTWKLLPALCLGLVICSTAMAGVTLKRNVVPILNQHCVMCHIAGAAQAGLDLFSDPWAATVNVRSTQSELNLVVPHEPDKSYLYLKLTGEHAAAGGSGSPMPFQPDVLSPAELAIFKEWIELGAPDD
jgi:hypothetical protein